MTGDDSTPVESASGESSTNRPTTPIDADAAFDILADSERRAMLTCLEATADGTATTTELIDCICRRQEDEASDVPARDRVALHVHHNHLPKLADAGVVEHDRRTETVRYRGSSFLEALLDAGRTEEATRATGETRAAEATGDDETE